MVVGLVVGKRQSRPWIVSDELWSLIEPLLPEPGPKLVEGRPRMPDRQALCGILFVLHTGIQWEYLPQELGFGSGMTCWRRLAEWNEAGVWQRLHEVLLAELRGGGAAGLVAGGDRLLPRPGRSGGAQNGPEPGRPRHGRAASTT